jgi:hypothetical protein
MRRNVVTEAGKQVLVVLLGFIPFVSPAQHVSWEFGLSGGAAYNFHTPLDIIQSGQKPLSLHAHYITEPFKSPFYYTVALAHYKSDRGIALKLTHHKLILENLIPEIQRFSITDGFNLLTINRIWVMKALDCSIGAGVVITHPESTIRNRPFPENKGILQQGYYLSGPTIEAALRKRYFFADSWFISAEGRATASYVEVPVFDGHARVSNLALHGLFGVGYAFNRQVNPR